MREIIRIDESLCDGCGKCITACAEGAIEIENGKARIVNDSFCDGLGACLGVCPKSALKIEQREAAEYDEASARWHKEIAGRKKHPHSANSASPCSRPISLDRVHRQEQKAVKNGEPEENELCSWPIQMGLVRPWAAYLQDSRLLVAGDCTAFAYPAIQQDFIRGRVVLVGCPKLDEADPFVETLSEILKRNNIRDISVLHMTVPCCSQLCELVSKAIKLSGKDVPAKIYVVGIDGKLKFDG